LNKILPLTLSATRRAAEIYANLRKKGEPIGHTDCLIAGIALSNNLQLVTNNIDHFKRIKGLEIVNWLK
jgi:predicted nucleic acid-binding protein